MKTWLKLFAAGVLAAVACSSAAVAQKRGEAAPDIPFEKADTGNKFKFFNELRGRLVLVVIARSTDPQISEISESLKAMKKSVPRVHIVWMAPEAIDKLSGYVKGQNFGFDISMLGFEGGELSGWNLEVTRAVLLDSRLFVYWMGHPLDPALLENLRDEIKRMGGDEDIIRRKIPQIQTWLTAKEAGRAYTMAKSILAQVDQNTPQFTQVDALVKQCVEVGKKAFDEAKEKIKAKEWDAACKILADLSVRMTGEDFVKDVDTEIGKLQADSDSKSKMRKAMENARAYLHIDQASELEAMKDFIEAQELYKEVIEKYGESDGGKEAQKAIDRINNDPTVRRQIDTLQNEREASRWLDIADRYAKVGMFAEAREWYEKVIKEHASSPAGERAKERLSTLPKEQPKPEGEKKDEAKEGEKKDEDKTP